MKSANNEKNKSKMKTNVLKNHKTVHLRKILRMLCIEIGTTPNGLIISGTIGVKTSNSLCLIFGFAFQFYQYLLGVLD